MTMLADLKSYLSIEATDTNHDSLLSMIVSAIEDRADRYMGLIHFGTVTDADKLFDGGVNGFFLPHANVTVSSVVRTSYGEEEFDTETVDPSYYIVDSPRGVVRMRSGVLEGGRGAITITYSGGYGEAAAPASLLFAVLKQAAYEFRRRKDPGLSAVAFPDGTVNKFTAEEWLPDVKKELDMRRRFYV